MPITLLSTTLLFNSYPFIFLFLPVTAIVFFGLTRFRLVKLALYWLILSSLIFYGYWNPAYVPLLLVSIVGNFWFGRQISRSQPQSRAAKILLWLGISFNLGILGYYKYAEFFTNSLNQWLGTSWTVPEILLPLGISFYSFTQIAYLVDSYRRETQQKTYDFSSYLLFVTFFPQLIAGPILRHNELIPEFHKPRNFVFSHRNMAMGLTLFALGLAKKVLIADSLAPWANQVFENADSVSTLGAWIGALSYTFQLYFDFSGYSDMAVGLGWMFNVHLPFNFNSPYKSTSIVEFWRRWHITLSQFLKDYLYIPLGGSRRGEGRRYTNLIITMLLGGLWHGAGWTFVIWGGLHGLGLAVNHAWRKLGWALPAPIAWLLTFLVVVAGWVIFRAENWSDASQLLQVMSGLQGITLPSTLQDNLPGLSALGIQFIETPDVELSYRQVLGLTALLLAVLVLPNTQQMMERFKPTLGWIAIASGLTAFCLVSLNRVSEFLYFQF